MPTISHIRHSVLLLLCVTGISGAQTPADPIHWSFGVAAGQLKFPDGSSESALGGTIAARAWDWLDLSVNPTYAWVRSAPVPGGSPAQQQGRSANGVTDLPLTIGVSHDIPGPWSPSVGLSLGITLPTGDTATVGSGSTGVGVNLNVGFAPTDNFSFDIAAGRSISDNGYSAGFASSSPTSLALSTLVKAGTISVGLSLSGDVGAASSGFESAQSLAAGVAIPVGRGMSLNFDGSAGLTPGAPTWAFAVGIGTTASGIVAATVAPYQRLRRAFGQGTKIKSKPRTK